MWAMAFKIYVRMKKAGKQKKDALAAVEMELEKRPETAEELLTALAVKGVREYNERKDEGQVFTYLTREEIVKNALSGKISFGLRGGEDADEDRAVENVLQCFEDGIFRVFAGAEELTELKQRIPWTEETVFTFIRLTMLSGW